MNDAAAIHSPRGHSLWVKVLVGLVILVALLALVLAFFPWDTLRGPLNRYVSNKTGRHFEITRKLDVKLGRNTRVLADGIVFANPEWAKDPYLVKAESAEIQIELLPLLKRRIVLPLIELRQPQLGLQMEADGRRTWALGRDSGNPRNVPAIGALVVDQGSAHLIVAKHEADIHTEFSIDGPLRPGAAPAQARAAAAPASSASAAGRAAPGATSTTATTLPLSFKAQGTWQKQAFTAQGQTGNVLYLSGPLKQPFPMEVVASAGRTSLRAKGSIASLATLDGADAVFDLQGHDLADLYHLVGVVLPSTPRYTVHGHVSKQAEVWQVRDINGKLGNSDLHGELAFDRGQQVPVLSGKLTSRALDFDDLAPLVGLPEQPRSAAALPEVTGVRAAPVAAAPARAARDPARRVLPTAKLDVARLKAMNSDVSYRADRITHAKQLPLDHLAVHVRLKDGVLRLDDLNVGVAGGTFTGHSRIDGNSNPAAVDVTLDGRGLELAKLFPNAKLTKASLGKIHGDIDLKGRGNSVALLMGRGEISNLILEIAGLDGAEILKFLSSGDRNVLLRCAAAAFDVKSGLMSSRALVLDTEDTVIYGDGEVSLATEEMDITLRPYPKDMSILSLRSPLKIAGTFSAPKGGPDKGALAGRAGVALALGAINPLLALASTIETGPGKDANCGAILKEAASPEATARISVMSQNAARRKGRAILGGAPAPDARSAPAGAKPAQPAVAERPAPAPATRPGPTDRPGQTSVDGPS